MPEAFRVVSSENGDLNRSRNASSPFMPSSGGEQKNPELHIEAVPSFENALLQKSWGRSLAGELAVFAK